MAPRLMRTGMRSLAHGHDDHGHGEPHESPMVMLVPLMILAVLSVVGGLVGIGNRFEHFLAPVFGSGQSRKPLEKPQAAARNFC